MPTIAEVAEIGIGMLGYAFMGKAHSNAFRKIAYMTWPPPLEPRLVGIAVPQSNVASTSPGKRMTPVKTQSVPDAPNQAAP